MSAWTLVAIIVPIVYVLVWVLFAWYELKGFRGKQQYGGKTGENIW